MHMVTLRPYSFLAWLADSTFMEDELKLQE